MVLRHFGLPFFIGAAIFVLLMLPSGNMNEFPQFGDFPIDKLVHVLLFATFTLSLTISFKKQPSGRIRQRAFIFALLTGAVFGGVTELAQHVANLGRAADPLDFLADLGGCFLSIPVFKLIYGKECQYR